MGERMKIFEYFDKYRDFTDERVKDGIEKYRKGNLKINVTDADGKCANGKIKFSKNGGNEFSFSI